MPSAAFLDSSIGKKYLMAVSGLVLLGFVIAHLLGNLLIFFGPDVLNAYAKKLRDLGPLLWVARTLLLSTVIAHIVSAVWLSIENRRARGRPYERKTAIQTTGAAETMMLSGLLILTFIVYHLLHLTLGVTHPEISHLKDAMGRHDVYSMVVLSFRDFPVAIFYILMMGFLCMHLAHGISSSFQSLGLSDEGVQEALKLAGYLVALLIFAGYISIPVASLTGWFKVGV